MSGLADKLTAPADPGLDQPTRFQEGVETILELLRSSGRPVDVVTTGSVRDLAAAYNREPELVKNKVRRVTAFIGEASSDFLEYNVQLDPNAWVRLLRSGLNLYWVPCFDGQTEGGTLTNHGHASFWLAPHRDLLADCAPELLQYFIYCFDKLDTPPVGFLRLPPEPDRVESLLNQERNLWCAAVFTGLADHRIVRERGRFFSGRAGERDDLAEQALFDFEPVRVAVDDSARVRYVGEGEGVEVMRFRVLDKENYAAGMTQMTNRLLASIRPTGHKK